MHPLTRSCFLLLLVGRLFLLALPVLLGICLCSLWSPPIPLHALSNPLFSRQGVALAHLDSLPHDLLLWTDSSVPFPFGKGGSGVLANCSLCGTEATLSFSARPVCLSFSAEACAILQALCWSWQHQQICRFSSLLLLFDSRSVLSSIFLLISNSVADLAGTVFPLSCSIRLQWVLGLSFLPGNDAADKLTRRGALLAPSAIPCKPSPLISRIHYCLFSDWRHTVSSKYFDSQVPSISTEELVLPRHDRCKGHSLLLGSYFSRIGRFENPSAAPADTSHFILHCTATDSMPLTRWQLSVSLRPLIQILESCPGYGAPWSSAMPPSLGRGRVINNILNNCLLEASSF